MSPHTELVFLTVSAERRVGRETAVVFAWPDFQDVDRNLMAPVFRTMPYGAVHRSSSEKSDDEK